MSKEVAERIRAELAKPEPRPVRDDLEVAAAMLEAVDSALQTELSELRRTLQIRDAEYAALREAYVAIVDADPGTKPEPDFEPADTEPLVSR